MGIEDGQAVAHRGAQAAELPVDHGGRDARVDEDVPEVVEQDDDGLPLAVVLAIIIIIERVKNLLEQLAHPRQDGAAEHLPRDRRTHPLHAQRPAAVDGLEQRVDHVGHHRGRGGRSAAAGLGNEEEGVD